MCHMLYLDRGRLQRAAAAETPATSSGFNLHHTHRLEKRKVQTFEASGIYFK